MSGTDLGLVFLKLAGQLLGAVEGTRLSALYDVAVVQLDIV